MCSAAHVSLNDQLQAAGVELQPDPNTTSITASFPDANHEAQFTVVKEEDWPAYDRAARRVVGEMLPELRALNSPEPVRAPYEGLAFPLMERFANGGEAPFRPPPASWIHRVERFPGLYDCTFNLRR